MKYTQSHAGGELSVTTKFLGQRLECGDIAADDCSCTIEAIVIPATPIPDLKAFIATLDAMACIGLAVVGALSQIYFNAGDQ